MMDNPALENVFSSGGGVADPGENTVLASGEPEIQSSNIDSFAIDTLVNENEMLEDLLEEHMLIEKIKAAKQFEREIKLRNQRVTNCLSAVRDEIVAKSQHSELDVDSLFSDSNDVLDVAHKTNNAQSKEDRLSLLNKSLSSNLMFQASLSNWENKLEYLLSENLKMQSALLKGLECPNETPIGKEFNPWMFVTFGMPYFKDKLGFKCPQNREVEARIQNNHPLTMDFHNSGNWSLKEKTQLKDCVLSVLKENAIENLSNRVEQIKRSNEGNIESRMEIARLRGKIENIKQMSGVEIGSEFVVDDKFDWLTISQTVFKGHRSAQECNSVWELCMKPSLNNSTWTMQEESELVRLAQLNNEQDWDDLASKLGTNRSGYECFVHYQRELNKNLKNLGKWSYKEDQELIRAVEFFKSGNHIPWRKISYFFNKRSLTQLRLRWKSSLAPHLKKGPFSEDEDRIILQSIEQFGLHFGKIASFLPNRSIPQIRARFLRAKFTSFKNQGRWSLEEDKLLMKLVGEYGIPMWSQISKHFLTRTRTQIRQRYAHIKALLEEHPGLGLEDIMRKTKQENEETSEETPSVSISRPKPKSRIENILKDKRRRPFHNTTTGVGAKLTAYFQESCPMAALCGQQNWDATSISSKANSILDLCRLLNVDLSYINNSDRFKALSPYRLRQVMKVLVENHGNELKKLNCLNDMDDIKSSSLSSQTLRSNEFDTISPECSNTLIDYSPCKVEDTFYNGIQLNNPSQIKDNNSNPSEELSTKYKVVEEEKKKKEHFLNFPFLIPPNVATAIGFRSLLVIERKLKRVLDAKSESETPKLEMEENDESETFPNHSTLNIEVKVKNEITNDGGSNEDECNENKSICDKNFIKFSKDESAHMFRERLKTIFGFPMILGESSDQFVDVKNLPIFKEQNDNYSKDSIMNRPKKAYRTSPYTTITKKKVECEPSSSQIGSSGSLSTVVADDVNSCSANASSSTNIDGNSCRVTTLSSIKTDDDVSHSQNTRRSTRLAKKRKT